MRQGNQRGPFSHCDFHTCSLARAPSFSLSHVPLVFAAFFFFSPLAPLYLPLAEMEEKRQHLPPHALPLCRLFLSPAPPSPSLAPSLICLLSFLHSYLYAIPFLPKLAEKQEGGWQCWEVNSFLALSQALLPIQLLTGVQGAPAALRRWAPLCSPTPCWGCSISPMRGWVGVCRGWSWLMQPGWDEGG